LNLDWRSPGEFQGYLVRFLEGGADRKVAEDGWDTPSEKSWLFYAAGLAAQRKEDGSAALNLFRESLVSAEPGSWESYLSGSAMDRAQKILQESAGSETAWKALQTEAESFEEMRRAHAAKEKDVREKRSGYKQKKDSGFVDSAERRQLLEDILKLDSRNRNFLAELAFTCSMAGSWSDALGYARAFLATEGRPNSARLGIGLLEPALLRRMGMEEEARRAVSDFVRRTRDPWYRRIGDCLLGKQTESSLMEEARRRPEDLLTAGTALGMWAEGAGETDRAIRYYREALESFIDTWIEYDLAAERIIRLRKSGPG
jgi:tetratricopeptide (TPR) repeat protein